MDRARGCCDDSFKKNSWFDRIERVGERGFWRLQPSTPHIYA